MKLFYTPVERMLLSIDDCHEVTDNDYLRDACWKLFDKYFGRTKLSVREARILDHVRGLLQV